MPNAVLPPLPWVCAHKIIFVPLLVHAPQVMTLTKFFSFILIDMFGESNRQGVGWVRNAYQRWYVDSSRS